VAVTAEGGKASPMRSKAMTSILHSKWLSEGCLTEKKRWRDTRLSEPQCTTNVEECQRIYYRRQVHVQLLSLSQYLTGIDFAAVIIIINHSDYDIDYSLIGGKRRDSRRISQVEGRRS
jgi:hypothetical protein